MATKAPKTSQDKFVPIQMEKLSENEIQMRYKKEESKVESQAFGQKLIHQPGKHYNEEEPIIGEAIIEIR